MSCIKIADGRSLDVEVTGPDGGFPLVFHHGTPGAVTQFGALTRAVHSRGMRMVTFSRAGYGASDRQPGRRVIDAGADVAEVLDWLGESRCVTAGWSGGGPHALATAAVLKERVAGVLVIAGVAPYELAGLDFLAGMGQQNLDEFGAALQGEAPLRSFLDGEAKALRNTDAAGVIMSMSTLLPDIDRAVLTDEFGADLAASYAEGLRLQVDGWIDDDLAFTAPWGFQLTDVAVPVFLWQGSADLMVPFAHGQQMANHIGGRQAHLLEDEGHLSLTVGFLDQMLDELFSSIG